MKKQELRLLNFSPRLKSRSRGFSIIELLVASALFVALLGAIVVILSGANKTTSYQSRVLFTQKLGVFLLDRIEQDFLRRSKIAGATLVLGKSPNHHDDSIVFICEGRLANEEEQSSNARMRGVYYKTNTLDDNDENQASESKNFTLNRGVYPLQWEGNADDVAEMLSSLSGKISAQAIKEENEEAVGEGIFRFTVTLLLKNGELIPNQHSLSNYPRLSSFEKNLPGDFTAVDLSKIRSLTITMALLDPQSAKQFAPYLTLLPTLFPDPDPMESQSVVKISAVELWKDLLIKPRLENIPPQLLEKIQFVQKTIVVE